MRTNVRGLGSLSWRFTASLAPLLALASCAGEVSDEIDEIDEVAEGLASPIYLRPTDDATVVSKTHQNSNYGNDPTLQVDAVDSQTGEERSFLRFDVGSIAGRIGRARLRLEVLAASSGTVNVYKTPSTSWNQSSITWNNQPTFSSGNSVTTIGPTSVGQLVYVDVTNAVAPNSAVSFALSSTSSDNVDFASKEHATARRPSLIIDKISACTPATATPTMLTHCGTGTAQSPQIVTAQMSRVASGVAVTQLTDNDKYNIAYYDIPAVVAGSDRFVYSRVREDGQDYTHTMKLDGTDDRVLTGESASSSATFVTPDGAMAYFPRKTGNSIDLMAMNLTGSACSASAITAKRGLVGYVPQISPPSRSCTTDKWVIAYATDHQLHRIKGKVPGALWASMGDYTLSDPQGAYPFHNIRLSPTCPNILMYSRNEPDSTQLPDGGGQGWDGVKETYLVDLDRDLSPYYLASGKSAGSRFPSHPMWSSDGLRVSYTYSATSGSTDEPRQLMIGDIVNPDCSLRTTNPDGTSNLVSSSGLGARTFKGKTVHLSGDAASYIPKFCSWSADDQYFACSGYTLAGGEEDESAIFLLNQSTGATRFLTTTDEKPGQSPYHGQSHLQFAGTTRAILFDSDRLPKNQSVRLLPQVYKVTYTSAMLP